MPPTVSVISVNYHSRPWLDRLLASLRSGKFHNFEILVVDNDAVNIGYGSAVNLAALQARGDYLFIVNPDTRAFSDTLDNLVKFLDTHPQAAIAAPLLLDPHLKPYPLQGTRQLTPLSAFFALSFLNSLFPDNPVSRAYWLADWDKTSPASVDVVPGTAFLIRRRAFDQVQGFDPHFFLYFEESDLCRQLGALGWQMYIIPAARLIHFWGQSTPSTPQITRVFSASRYYYFRKHFGPLTAFLVHSVCSLSRTSFLLVGIFLLGTILRLWQLTLPLPAFPDQAWFINSATIASHTGQLPLLGITTSITWLHQGPLWTYFLIPAPYSGAVITTVLSLVTFPLLYGLARRLKSTRSAIFAVAVYAFLPYFIRQSVTSYHTSLLPILTVIFGLSLITRRSFMAGLFTGWLYQLHLLTFIFWPLPLYYYFKSQINVRTFLAGFILGLLPFILSGPVQTLGIFAWMAKQLLTGFTGVSGISDAYIAVLATPLLLLISRLL